MKLAGRIAVILVSLIAVGGVSSGGARDRADAGKPKTTGPQEAEVVGVMVNPRTETPVILLEGKRDKRKVFMSIDLAQVTAIALPLQGVTPPRPLTHDLFLTLFGRLKVSVTRVVITDLRDDVYYATVHLTGPAGEMTLDSRPSDAIALAVRAKVPVLVEDRVFDKGAVPDGPGRTHI
jgi:bifunctional DNase/RNase